MIHDLSIAVLAESIARGAGLLGERGLAFWIEAVERCILFDTGQGNVLCHNAKCLKIRLDTLYAETPAGTVVVLGCAHAGVVDTLDYVVELTSRDQIYIVFIGTHLLRATAQRLAATIEALKRYRVRKIGTAHCVGARATSYLWFQLPDERFECCVETIFSSSV